MIGLDEERVNRTYSRIVKDMQIQHMPVLDASLFVERAVHQLHVGDIGKKYIYV
jgi:transcription initiation factor TFIIIB Brf1 subunit/transcription initiation factor TFIIB